jgi:putative transposase
MIRGGEEHRKSLSRKQKDSKNREKAKIKVAKIHAQITDSRKG